MNGATLGAVAGFVGAVVTVGIPLVTYLYRVDGHAKKAVRILTGEEEVEQDGVLPRLRRVEKRSIEHRLALRETDVDVPDLAARTDGGRDEVDR